MKTEDDLLKRLRAQQDATRVVPEIERGNDFGRRLLSDIGAGIGNYLSAGKEALRNIDDEERGLAPRVPGQNYIQSRQPSLLERGLAYLPEPIEDAVMSAVNRFERSPVGAAVRYASSPEFLADIETGGLASGARLASAAVSRPRKLPGLGPMWDKVLDIDEATEIALRGDHLRPKKGGGFQGAPENVRSMEDIERNRENALNSLEIGVQGFNWYDRARDFGSTISGYNPETMLPDSPQGRLASMFARGGAVHSSNTSPSEEVRKFVMQHNTRALTGSEPTSGMYRQPVEMVARGYENIPGGGITIDPTPVTGGRKTGNYAQAKDPNFPKERRFHSVNDIWHGRGMGYGEDFSGSFSEPQHSFLAGETLAIADMANKRGIGSGTGIIPEGFRWDPDAAQAAIWVGERFKSEKRADLAAIAKALEDGKTPPAPRSDEEIMEYALSGVDNLQRHYLDDTVEFVTGKGSGHLSGMTDAPESLRQEYTDRMADAYFSSPSGDLRDPVYDALDMYQYPATPMRGTYINSAGEIENNPGFVVRPVTAIENRTNPRSAWMLNEPDASAVGIASNLRGLLTAQEAVARTKVTPNTIDRVRMTPFGGGYRYTGDDLEAARRAFEERGLDVVEVGDALNVGSFGGDITSREIIDRVEDAQSGLRGRAEPGLFEATYQEIPWTPEQGTGQASRAVFDRIEQYEEGLMNPLARIDTGRLRQSIDAMNEIDQQIAATTGMPIREDLMRLRDMIRDVGVEGVARYIKETGGAGLPVAAALVPSLSYLLEERENPER